MEKVSNMLLELSDIRIDLDNYPYPKERIEPASLVGLSNSLVTEGMEYPVLVRKYQDEYHLIHGYRRYFAVQALGWPGILVDIIT